MAPEEGAAIASADLDLGVDDIAEDGHKAEACLCSVAIAPRTAVEAVEDDACGARLHVTTCHDIEPAIDFLLALLTPCVPAKLNARRGEKHREGVLEGSTILLVEEADGVGVELIASVRARHQSQR